MTMKSKRLRNFLKSDQYKGQGPHDLDSGLQCVLDSPSVSFDETIELIFSFSSSFLMKRQSIKGFFPLPKGLGKKLKFAAIVSDNTNVPEDNFGADFVGSADFVSDIINKKKVNYDIIFAHTSAMPMLAKAGKILGPKGLMPNIASGTVCNDLKDSIKVFRNGAVMFSMTKYGSLHVPCGKKSFSFHDLKENITAFYEYLDSLVSCDINSILNSIYIKSTMSPSYRISFLKS